MKLGNNLAIVQDNGVTMIISYNSIIMKIKDNEIIEVGEDWDYSTTTSKHLTKALEYLGFYKLSKMNKEQRRKVFIEQGLI